MERLTVEDDVAVVIGEYGALGFGLLGPFNFDQVVWLSVVIVVTCNVFKRFSFRKLCIHA